MNAIGGWIHGATRDKEKMGPATGVMNCNATVDRSPDCDP